MLFDYWLAYQLSSGVLIKYHGNEASYQDLIFLPAYLIRLLEYQWIYTDSIPLLERIGVARDPYCDQCLADGAVNPICDTEHFFCLCIKVAESWRGIKEIICNLLQEKPNDADLLTLIFPGTKFDKKIMWLLGSYFEYVWSFIYVKGVTVCRAQLFGHLRFKYKKDQLGARANMDSKLMQILNN